MSKAVFTKINLRNNKPINMDKQITNSQDKVAYIEYKIFNLIERKPFPQDDHIKKLQLNEKEKKFMSSLGEKEQRKYIFKKKVYEAFAGDDDEAKILEEMMKITKLSDLFKFKKESNTTYFKKLKFLKLRKKQTNTITQISQRASFVAQPSLYRNASIILPSANRSKNIYNEILETKSSESIELFKYISIYKI